MVFFFQRALAIVNVTGHVGRVVAELDGEVLAAGVLQLAVLSFARTNEYTVTAVNALKVPRRRAGANTLLSTKSQLH